MGNYKKAIELGQASLERAREKQNLEEQRYALIDLGALYRKVGQKEQAVAAYQELLAITTKTEVAGNKFNALAGLGRTYRDLNRPVTAITYYKQAINESEEIRTNIRGLSPALQQSFLQVIQDSVNNVKTVDAYRELADLLLSQGQISEAQQVLELLKVQELRDFTRNTSAIAAPQTTLTPAEAQIIKENGTLIAFGQRINQCQQTRCSQLSQLLDRRDALTEQFNQKVQTIERQVREQSSKEPATIRLEDLRRKAQEIVKAQPDTVLIYPLVLENKIWLGRVCELFYPS